MKITLAQNETIFDNEAASRIVNQICRKPSSVIGLSTGRTTGNMHRLVCALHKKLNFDVGTVTFFGLDEVTGVPREYSGACYTMLRTEIIDDLGISDDRFLMLPTISNDYERECSNFRAELKRRGGIDLLMLGLGENGRERISTVWHRRQVWMSASRSASAWRPAHPPMFRSEA